MLLEFQPRLLLCAFRGSGRNVFHWVGYGDFSGLGGMLAVEPDGFEVGIRITTKKRTIQQDNPLFLGDPYGTRTHVTAVKGRCLNHLTNGPGSGNLTRTDDTPGMNRMLYQLSYAAILPTMPDGRVLL